MRKLFTEVAKHLCWADYLLVGLAIVLGIAVLLRPAHAQQTFSLNGLSTQEILIIGAGLDKLPREVTDQNDLYQRIQAQITQQNQAAAKAKSDADKAALDKAVAAAIEKAKAEKPEEPQP